MAPKRPTHDIPPPTHSSDSESEDQEHSSSSEDSDSEPQQLTQSKPQQLTQSKPHQESSGSDSDSGSDADSDSSSDKTQKAPSVVSPEPKKPTSKSTQLKANGKRPAETEQNPITQSKPHQESSGSDSDSGSDADSDSTSDKTQKAPSVVSPEPKKPTSKSTQLKANGKRPAETEQIEKGSKSKKSKGVEKLEKDSKSDKSKSVEKVDKGSKSDEKVDKGSKSVEKVGKGSKKSKLSNGDEEGGEIEDKKATLFARLFTEKDEIVLLEGMIDYKEKKGADPSLNVVAFHESVEDLLSCSVTKSQIADKIRRLKKKFMNYVRKGENGEDPVISRPHEYKSFELSKKIWGNEVRGSEVDGDSRVKTNRRKNKKDDNVGGSKTPLKSVGKKESDIEEEVPAETENCRSLYPYLCASLESEAIKNFTLPTSPKEFVKKVVGRIQKENASELEREWNGIIEMEQQVYAKRVKMISKQAEIVMNAIQP